VADIAAKSDALVGNHYPGILGWIREIAGDTALLSNV